MAIDSEDKRCSAANLFIHNLLPVPDSSIDAADRSHVDVYRGIVTSAPPEEGNGPCYLQQENTLQELIY